MLEIHTNSFIQRHILQNSGKFLLQKSEVRLSCKTTFRDERTNQLTAQNSTVARGFSSAHTLELCVLLTPSRLNCASSVNRMYRCNWRMPLSHLQNSSLSANSPGPRCCTRCTWYGYMPSACSVLHTLVWGTRRHLAILRVLARGLQCTK